MVSISLPDRHLPDPDRRVDVRSTAGKDRPIRRKGYVGDRPRRQQGHLFGRRHIVEPDANPRSHGQELPARRQCDSPVSPVDLPLAETGPSGIGQVPGMEVALQRRSLRLTDRQSAEGKGSKPLHRCLYRVHSLAWSKGEERSGPAIGVARDPLHREPAADLAIALGDRESDLDTGQGIVVLVPHLDDERISQGVAAPPLLTIARDRHQPSRTRLHPLRYVPHRDLAISRCRSQCGAMRREGHYLDTPARTTQLHEPLLRHRVPQMHGWLRVSGGEHRAVSGEGYRMDGPVMPGIDGGALTLRHVP